MTESKRPAALFVASNLHGGGGVQVAASLIDELANLRQQGAAASWDIDFEVSSAVAKNARPEALERLNCRVTDRRPKDIRNAWSGARRRYDVVFVVFGPIYARFRARRRVMGYADVTSLYPDPLTDKWSLHPSRVVRRRISRWQARRQDLLVVETGEIRERMRSLFSIDETDMRTVPNALNSKVVQGTTSRTSPLQQRLESVREKYEILLFYPTRPYPHKNIKVLPEVVSELARRGLQARVLTTLNAREWKTYGPVLGQSCVNLGELAIDEVGTALHMSDGVLFPSLLEAFSATPLEALAASRPLFASDRAFVRSVCRDAAFYFDPHDPRDVAHVISQVVGNEQLIDEKVRLGQKVVGDLPSAADRARRILALITEEDLDDRRIK